MREDNIVSLTQVRRLRIGRGSAALCAADCAESGARHALIVTCEPLQEMAQKLHDRLARRGVAATIWLAPDGEPTRHALHTAIDAATDCSADFVIGFGGGSAMDIAKLVAALHGGGQSFDEVGGIGLLKTRLLPLACIPTTAGTGSEATPIAVIEDEEEEIKKGVVSPHLVPDYAYLDPETTISAPPGVTASTGLDALTHCIEAYANRHAHPMVDAWALEGIRLITTHLERAWRKGDDVEAREAMLRASHLGGLCLGPVNTAAVHALAYPLGGEFHIPHGVANSLLLPHVLRFNLSAAPSRYAAIAHALGLRPSGDDMADATAGIEAIERLSAAVRIDRRLSDLGIGSNALPKMAAAAMSVQRLLRNNPRELSEEDALRIYEAAL